MRKRMWIAALALAVAGAAGAQTTSCTAIPDPVVPKFQSGGWTRTEIQPDGTTDTPPSGFAFLSNTDPNYSDGTAETLLYNVDFSNRLNEYRATSPIITINNVRYIQVGFVFANNGWTGGSSTTFDFKYNGVTYVSIISPGPSDADPNTARVVAANGAAIYNTDGSSTPITTTDKANQTGDLLDNAIVNTRAGYRLDVSLRKIFYIRLPDDVAPTGQLIVSKRAEDNPETNYGDDFRIWLPRAFSTSLCLQKKLDVGTVPNNFEFVTTNTDNSLVSTSATGPVVIPVADTTNSFSRAPNSGSGPNALAVTNPSSITITENAPGFTITRVTCDRPPYRDGNADAGKAPTPGNNVVSLNGNTATITSLTIGAMTTCTFYNSVTTQVAFPKFTLVKNFTGFENAADSVNITISEAGGSSSSATVTNAGTRTGSTTYTGTKLLFGTSNTTTNTVASGVPPVFTLGETFATGTATNYTRTYSCSNAKTGSTTTLVTAGTALPAGGSINVQPAQGDDITCTFVNNLTVAAPTTSVSVTKTGKTVVTAGTAVTYTIRYVHSGTDPVMVQVTDVIGTPLPTGTLVSVPGGSYNADTQTATWPAESMSPTNSFSKQVIINIPDPVKDAVNGDTYTGPNQVTDTASIKTFEAIFDKTIGDYKQGVEIANTGDSDETDNTITTNHLFAQVRKTVQNLSTGGSVGTTAEAVNGDTLKYCLNYINQSAIPMTLTLKDTLVDTQTLIAGTFTGGTNTGTGNQVNVVVPDVAAGASGSVCFQAKVNQ